MAYVETTATKKISELDSRIRAVQGGTSASKTISILLYLIARAQYDTSPTLTSVVSESFPHLRRAAIKDFLDILEQQGYFDPSRWDKTNSVYTFETGSKIEFFSADQPQKVRGPRRDRLFINEANNVPYETFDQLEVRTKEFIFLDWNPTNEFWFYTEVEGRSDCQRIILTYKDNEALAQTIIDAIEQRRNRKGWFLVYGEGQLGEVEGKIYKDWEIIDELPMEARLDRRGGDFGFSNDPTALVNIYRWNGSWIIDEIAFRKGLLNKQIADICLSDGEDVLTVFDSAEPKSIAELRAYGVNVIAALKGADSVRNGIAIVQGERIFITKRSANVIHEYRNYLWETDVNGKILPKPEHTFSHSMDAIRYGLSSLIHPSATGGITTSDYDYGEDNSG